MKISTRGRYGLKAMVDLAVRQENDKCISLKSIAETQGISENYLEQLIAPLKKAGLVISTRGAQGGYRLSKNPDEISLRDILTVLEGSLYPVECLNKDGEATSCGDSDCSVCVTKSVWTKIYGGVTETLDAISLGDLVNEHNENINK